MRIFKLAIMILCVSFLSAYIHGQETSKENSFGNYPSVKIADSQERIFYSDIYKREITLQIYLPMGYEESDSTFKKYPNLAGKSEESYPVLYLLDSDVYFGMASVIARLLQWEKKLPGLIIVGVSYGLSDWYGKRALDYLPYSDSGLGVTGEADDYLKMYEKELIPYVESNFRADSSKRILFGHSSGGIFTLYTMFTKPELFNGYLAVSPWKRYLKKFFFDIEEKYFAVRKNLPVKLYLAMGDLELSELKAEWEKFSQILSNRNYQNLVMKNVLIEDESHLSVVPIEMVKGLQWYFSKEE